MNKRKVLVFGKGIDPIYIIRDNLIGWQKRYTGCGSDLILFGLPNNIPVMETPEEIEKMVDEFDEKMKERTKDE